MIEFENYYGYWKKEDPVLSNINLTFKKNKFYGIIGKVG